MKINVDNLEINPICHCSGKKGNLLSIKINNRCNGDCFFCIDKGGLSPSIVDVEEIVKNTILEKDYQIVTVTGGEPFLDFDTVVKLLEKIRPYKKEIILNTNGSLLTPEKVKVLNPLIDELRIALHHYDEVKNEEIIRTKISFDKMKDSLQHKTFKTTFNIVLTKAFKTTFNIVLTKALENEKTSFVNRLVDLCHKVHIDAVRISELKYVGTNKDNIPTYDKNHIKAWDFFSDFNVINQKTSEELVTKGCIDIFMYRDIEFHLKRLCGLKIPEKTQTFKVIYSDGLVLDDWIYPNKVK